MGRPPAAVTLHVERAHDDECWRRLAALATAAERKGARLTLFVATVRAGEEEAAARACERVAGLADRGHEVGQHTHYMASVPDPKGVTPTPADALACLDRDHRRLAAAGVRPAGFVAGSWSVMDVAFPWLRDHGFTYDSSFRAFPLTYPNPAAAAGDGRSAASWHEGLLSLPTSDGVRSGLGRHLRGRPRRVRLGDGHYEMYYLHDYDLLDGRIRAGTSALLALLARRCRFVLGRELAETAAACLPRP